ncbi:MAG: GAF domain-containing protein [Verrucomicrobiaceae bacterium]|nr:MAG: GAF domain-containing protein [Verrucomicrobiaceae bacterium]
MSEPDPIYPALLGSTLSDFGCQTGTIHRTTADGQHLSLVCQTGVPEALWDKITFIPFGKGIAGAAAERREPVELCNLQQDLGGVARPDARQTGVAGSLAVPILSGVSGEVIGTLGIGKYVPYEFTDWEKARLAAVAEEIAGHFGHKACPGD